MLHRKRIISPALRSPDPDFAPSHPIPPSPSPSPPPLAGMLSHFTQQEAARYMFYTH